MDLSTGGFFTACRLSGCKEHNECRSMCGAAVTFRPVKALFYCA